MLASIFLQHGRCKGLQHSRNWLEEASQQPVRSNPMAEFRLKRGFAPEKTGPLIQILQTRPVDNFERRHLYLKANGD